MATYFNNKNERLTVFFHALFTAVWLGATLSVIVVMHAKNTGSLQQQLAYSLTVKWLNEGLIIGSSLASLLTQMLLSWKTPLGFFRYWWVAIKLVLTGLVIMIGIGYMGPTINELIALLDARGREVIAAPAFAEMQSMIKVIALTQFFILVFLVYLSVFKPFEQIDMDSFINS